MARTLVRPKQETFSVIPLPRHSPPLCPSIPRTRLQSTRVPLMDRVGLRVVMMRVYPAGVRKSQDAKRVTFADFSVGIASKRRTLVVSKNTDKNKPCVLVGSRVFSGRSILGLSPTGSQQKIVFFFI